jgi:outer membrane protein OmpA-like peptidoglycan-associated protein
MARGTTMKVKLFVILISSTLLFGCASKENIIVLSESDDGSVGALKIDPASGNSVILDQPDMAIIVDSDESELHAPVPVDRAETTALFQEALAVHPLMPKSFLLYFESNSPQINSSSLKVIPEILRTVKERDSHDIAVVGHTDRTGDEAYNKTLSQKRAESVYDILISKGIKKEDIKMSYHGEGNLLIPTADNISEPANRRVEVMVR